ncbi:MAG: hypothetical protein FJ387_28270 [Verrucomicrobia bacterium]|nr:hypothetical protein [Verrucomicrobiota bacterium]
MKKMSFLSGLICLVVAGSLSSGEPPRITAQHLASHGLPAGPPREALPSSGALLHLQLHDLFSVLTAVEKIVVAGFPERFLPPDAQGLFETDHPLLTALGQQKLGEPLTAEWLAARTGLHPRGTASATLYLGDPRRMFIVSVPLADREPLADLLNRALRPAQVEAVTLGEKPALRVVTARIKGTLELFLVASEDTLYLCGDRSLAIGLHNTPVAQRLGRDPFMSRALPANDNQQVRFALNPAPIKPLALPLQGLGGLGNLVIGQQRAKLLASLPQEARDQFELQVRSQFGVRDLEQFADYAECILIATLEQIRDGVTGGLAAFEGLTLTSRLEDQVQQVNLRIYSQTSQTDSSTAALPLNEIRQALAWLGPNFQSFSATGRQPQPQSAPCLRAWVDRVERHFARKNLKSAALDRLRQLLEDRDPVPTVASQVPWSLETYAPLRPWPSLAEAASLEDYFLSIELPVHRSVTVVPGRTPAFLARCFESETEIRNRNRQLDLAFVDSFQKQRPWWDQLNRFEQEQLDGGVSRLVRESALITRGGIFGFDQHELVSRKIVWARAIGDYLVYHRGAKESVWLREFGGAATPGLAPGVAQLLDDVPAGANYVAVRRVLVGLPRLVDGLELLESRLHGDAEAYVARAQKLVDASADLETAKRELRGLKMPELIGSVNIAPQTKQVYALLPSGPAAVVFPRPRLVPVLRELLVDYRAHADAVGGCLVSTRAEPEYWELSVLQRWDALTTLTRTFGNAVHKHYLATPEQQRELHQKLSVARDGDRTVFDEVVARNPQWHFIPQPRPRTVAKPDRPIPAREIQDDIDRAEGAADLSRMVDLSDHYNAGLTDSWHKGGLPNNTLKDLPRGCHEFGGVTFDVRGIVQLAGQQAASELSVIFPEQVKGIAVGRKGQNLHVLHACGWSSPQGTEVATYVIHYADGQSREIPVTYGRDVQDWWLSEPAPADSALQVVWQGTNHASPDGPPVGLFKSTWPNPRPEVEIRALDYRSAMANSAPFLIAVTIE